MDTLELLKSLTQGVNNKVSQEQKSYEYIVNTSLKNKNKKSAPPIVKEVIVEKKEEEEIEEVYDFVESDEIIDENIDAIIDESVEVDMDMLDNYSSDDAVYNEPIESE